MLRQNKKSVNGGTCYVEEVDERNDQDAGGSITDFTFMGAKPHKRGAATPSLVHPF